MNEFVMEQGIIIEDKESVLKEISNLRGKKTELEVIRKFVQAEKSTKFFIDEKGKSFCEQTKSTKFLWIDTGFHDQKAGAIFIGLEKRGRVFRGNFVGSLQKLASRLELKNPKYGKQIRENQGYFISKYKRKVQERTCPFIKEEREYLMDKLNEGEGMLTLGQQISALNLNFEEEKKEEPVEKKSKEVLNEEEKEKREEKLTIAMLVDQIEEMYQHISKLEVALEGKERELAKEIETLEEENRSYKESMLQLREFMYSEEEVHRLKQELKEEKRLQICSRGHLLLPRNEKILVLGQSEVNKDAILSIAKNEFGFEKLDFEFEMDYKKVVSKSKRVHNSNRYGAIILGKCPHKVANIGNWSSIIAEFKQAGYDCISIDARNKAGELKVTKDSLRKALFQICEGLEREIAC